MRESYTLLSFRKRLAQTALNSVVFAGLFILLYSLIFNHAFDYSRETQLRYDTFVESSLYVEVDGTYTPLISDSYVDYENIVKKYYVGKINDSDTAKSYFDSEFYISNGGTRQSKDVKWYNETILDVYNNDLFSLKDDDINLFAELNSDNFEIVDGNSVLKEENNRALVEFFEQKYIECFEDLQNDDFYFKAVVEQNKKEKLRFFTSFEVSFVSLFLIIPLALKGKNLGQLVVNSCYVNKDGIISPLYKVAIKDLPLLVLGLLVLTNLNIYIFLTILLVYFLISFIFISFTKTRSTLSEKLASIVLVDKKQSTIFFSNREKEEYIEKETTKIENISNEYYKEGEDE